MNITHIHKSEDKNNAISKPHTREPSPFFIFSGLDIEYLSKREIKHQLKVMIGNKLYWKKNILLIKDIMQ